MTTLKASPANPPIWKVLADRINRMPVEQFMTADELMKQLDATLDDVVAAMLFLYHKYQAEMYLLVYVDGELVEKRDLIKGFPLKTDTFQYKYGFGLMPLGAP